MALNVSALAEPAAHLYLWTTQKFVWDAPDVVRAWGFPAFRAADVDDVEKRFGLDPGVVRAQGTVRMGLLGQPIPRNSGDGRMTEPHPSLSKRARDRWLRWRLRNVTIVQGKPAVRKVESDDTTTVTFRYEIPTRVEVNGRVSKRLVRRLVEQERAR